MPYKLGDVLWSLPVAKALSEKWEEPVDFITSEYCKPLLRLIKQQPWIDEVYTSPTFDQIISGNPNMTWMQEINIEGKWQRQHQVRFHSFPTKHIPEYFADLAGVTLEYPLRLFIPPAKLAVKAYIVINNPPGYGIALTGQLSPVIAQIIERCPLEVILVGKEEEAPKTEREIINLCGKADLLDTAQLMAQAVAYVGIPSSNATLASLIGTPQCLLVTPFAMSYWPIFHSLGEVHTVAVNEGDAIQKPVDEVLAMLDLIIENRKPPQISGKIQLAEPV